MTKDKKLNIAFAGGWSGWHVMPISSLIKYIYKPCLPAGRSEKYSDWIDNIFWFGQKWQMEEKEFEKLHKYIYDDNRKNNSINYPINQNDIYIDNKNNLTAIIINNNTYTQNIESIKSILSQKWYSTIDVISREIFKFNKQDNYDIYILSWWHDTKSANHLEYYDNEIELLKSDKNIIWICLWMQLIAKYFWSNIIINNQKIEWNIYIDYNNSKYEVQESHIYIIDKLGYDLEWLAKSDYWYEIIKHKSKNIYGLQFHQEKYIKIQDGDEIFESILDDLKNKNINISNWENISLEEKAQLFQKVFADEPRNDKMNIDEASKLVKAVSQKKWFIEWHAFDNNIYIWWWFWFKLDKIPFEFEDKISENEFIKKCKHIDKDFDIDKIRNLRNWFVDIKYRSLWIGNKLLNYREDKAKKKWAKYIVLSTLSDEWFQINRYKKNGYKVFWEVENFGHKLVFMIKKMKSKNASSLNNKESDNKSLVPTSFISILSWKLRRQPNFKEILLNITDIFKFLVWIFQSLWYIYTNKIDVVFCKWWYVALPVVIAAKMLGRKILVHESDTKSWLVNKIAAKFADHIYTWFEWVLAREQVIGQIISDDIVPSEILLKQSDKTTILVNLGSLGSASVHDALLYIFEEYPEFLVNYEWHIIIGSLNADYEAKYKTQIDKINYTTIRWKNEKWKTYYNISNNINIYTFVDQKKMWELLYISDISICRWGTTTLAEQKLFDIKQLIIPIPRTHDQANNAKYYETHFNDIYIAQDKNTNILGDNIYNEIVWLNKFCKRKPDLDKIKSEIQIAKKIICDEIVRR